MLDAETDTGSSAVVLRFLATLLLLLALTGCDRKHREGVVLEKEHIAAREPTPTPTAEPEGATPAESATLEAEPGEMAPDESATPEPELREMAPDEIAIDGLVMKKAVRGTGRDPRATTDERWIVKVQTTDGRIFNVPADQARFAKLHAGDRVQVVYRVGKYTGTVWSADFD